MKLRFICLVFLFCSCIFVTSYSYASINYSNLELTTLNLTKTEMNELIFTTVFGYDSSSFNFQSYYQNQYNTFLTDVSNNNYNTIYYQEYIRNNSAVNGIELKIWFNNGTDFTGGFCRQYTFFKIKSNGYMSCDYSTFNGNTFTLNFVPDSNYPNLYLYKNGDIYNAKLNSDIIKPDTDLRYTQYSDTNINVVVNGTSYNVPTIKQNRDGTIWNLGKFDNIQYLTSGTQIKVYLDPFTGNQPSYNNATFLYYVGGDVLSNKGLSITRDSDSDYDGIVYIDNRNVLYNQLYLMTIYINGIPLEPTSEFLYYFLPTSSIATSGEAINQDIYTQVGINDTLINTIQQTTAQDIQNLPYYFGNYYSGNLVSGDLVIMGLDYHTPSGGNYYKGFIHNIFNSVCDIFTTGGTNVALTINLHGYNRTFYSNDFFVPSSPIKTFVTLFLVVGTIILLIQQFYAFVIIVSTLDLNNFLRFFDVDFTYFM